MKVTTGQIKRFYALLGTTGQRAQKENILSGFGVASSKDLSYGQMNDLIQRLEVDSKRIENEKDYIAGKVEHKKVKVSSEVRKQRSVVLTILTKMGIYVDSSSWGNVNNYLMDSRIAGKMLYEMDEMELKTLQTKLRSILNKNTLEQKRLNFLAQNN